VSQRLVQLDYGSTGRFSCALDASRVSATLEAPRDSTRFRTELRTALDHPLEFPPLAKAVVPGDRVVVALDADTPHAAEIVAELWRTLEPAGVEPGGLLIVQPASLLNGHAPDPRLGLPEAMRESVGWVKHTPDDVDRVAYLASAASGERVYLARELVEADVVVSVGPVAYDTLIGYRGTNSVFYPSLSDHESILRARGGGHGELGPDEQRPLRQLADEVGWLLGSLFSIQVVPAAGGGASHVVAGATDPVFGLAKHYLNEHWRIELDERPECVVAAVDTDAGGHGWRQVAAAIANAHSLVARGGKIVVLSQLDEEPGEGLRVLAACDEPGDSLRPLRELAPADLVPASQLAAAAAWADVYLLAKHDPEELEDLFVVPLEEEAEVERVLATVESCVFLQSAQHVHGEIRG
jgi:nickel-dependent lactate racemase